MTNRRRHQRHTSDVIACELGAVLDISAEGIRIGCSSKPPVGLGQRATAVLHHRDGTLHVSAVVAWRKRKGWRNYEIGLRFVDMAPGVAGALKSLTTFGFVKQNSSGGYGQKKDRQVRASVNLPDYYHILGVKPDVAAEQIKQAYRLLVRTCHPDVCDEPDAVDKFMRIQEAYEVLSDDEQRYSYDLCAAG